MSLVTTQSHIVGSGSNISEIKSQPDAQPSFEIDIDNVEIVSCFNNLVFELAINSNGMTILIRHKSRLSELLDWSNIQRKIFFFAKMY